jgi:hypothetical protein
VRVAAILAPYQLDGERIVLIKNCIVENRNIRLAPDRLRISATFSQINRVVIFYPLHVVNLNYPNSQAVGTLCSGLNTDLDCYGKVRLEVIDGTDRTQLVNVNRSNSIENRLIMLLLYLHARSPGDGWGQYLSADNTLNWPVFVVGGHSQGGGHAGLLGRYHRVHG